MLMCYPYTLFHGLEFYISGVIQRYFLSGFFFSLSFVVFIHVEVGINISFFKSYIAVFQCTDMPWFVFPLTYWWAPVFLAIIIKALLTIHVQVSVQTQAFFSSWYSCTSEMAALYRRCMFTFLRDCQTVFHSPILLSHQHCMSIPVRAHPQQHCIIGLNSYHLRGT